MEHRPRDIGKAICIWIALAADMPCNLDKGAGCGAANRHNLSPFECSDANFRKGSWVDPSQGRKRGGGQETDKHDRFDTVGAACGFRRFVEFAYQLCQFTHCILRYLSA